jgi:hypothetical protein
MGTTDVFSVLGVNGVSTVFSEARLRSILRSYLAVAGASLSGTGLTRLIKSQHSVFISVGFTPVVCLKA